MTPTPSPKSQCSEWIIARTTHPDGDTNEWCCKIGAKHAATKARDDVLTELFEASEHGVKALLDKLDSLRTEVHP